MRVVIVGAGIGGLVLARALRDAGVSVVVHERDTDLADTGGYRLHLDSFACAALRRRLPASHYQALLASGAGPRSFRVFSVFDHRLRPLLSLPQDEAGDHLLIGRVPLRLLLAHGLDDVLRLGSEYTGHTRRAGGGVTARFADGSEAACDVLVAADGARSRVVAEVAGRPGARTLDTWGIAGRSPLSDELRGLVPRELLSGPAFAVGPRGTALFLSLYDPRTAAVSPRACRDVPPVLEPASVLWGIVTREPRDLDRSAAATASALVSGWSPRVGALLAATDPADVTAFPHLAANPDDDLTPWQAGDVTALGDAVHAMPPTGGQGAATAIRDADLLAAHLVEANDGDGTVALAIHAYQQAMPRYALPALRESLQPLRWQRLMANRPTYAAVRTLLPAVQRWQRVRRHLSG